MLFGWLIPHEEKPLNTKPEAQSTTHVRACMDSKQQKISSLPKIASSSPETTCVVACKNTFTVESTSPSPSSLLLLFITCHYIGDSLDFLYIRVMRTFITK